MSDTKKKLSLEGWIKKALKSPLAFPVIALLVMLLINFIIQATQGRGLDFFKISIMHEAGWTPDQGMFAGTPRLYGFLVDILNRSCELIILAVGMTLVVASSRGTDISVGSVMAISAAVIIKLLGESSEGYNMWPPLAILFGFLAATACGAFNGFLVAHLNIQPMVATLILFTAGRGIAQLICTRVSETGAVATGVILHVHMDSFKYIGGVIPGCPIPTPVFIAVAFVILTVLLLKKTALSLYIQTVGINPKAGRLVGLNSTFIMFFCYLFCGLAAGVSGMIASSRIYSCDANNVGLNLEMDAILAVALGGNSLAGGKFNMAGSVIGAITIQCLSTILYSLGVSADQLPVYKAVVVILIVLAQSPELAKLRAAAKLKRQNRSLKGVA